jgi:hypothetical protein
MQPEIPPEAFYRLARGKHRATRIFFANRSNERDQVLKVSIDAIRRTIKLLRASGGNRLYPTDCSS